MSLDDQIADLWVAGATMTDIGLRMGVSRSVIAGRLARARAKRPSDPRFGASTSEAKSSVEGSQAQPGRRGDGRK